MQHYFREFMLNMKIINI